MVWMMKAIHAILMLWKTWCHKKNIWSYYLLFNKQNWFHNPAHVQDHMEWALTTFSHSENATFSIHAYIEFIILPKRFILDTHTSYLLAPDWFIHNGLDLTYKWNPEVRYHLCRCIFTTDCKIFKGNFSQQSSACLHMHWLVKTTLWPFKWQE